jgi:hypothetical protein
MRSTITIIASVAMPTSGSLWVRSAYAKKCSASMYLSKTIWARISIAVVGCSCGRECRTPPLANIEREQLYQPFRKIERLRMRSSGELPDAEFKAQRGRAATSLKCDIIGTEPKTSHLLAQ